MPLAVEARCLNHWPARQVPIMISFCWALVPEFEAARIGRCTQASGSLLPHLCSHCVYLPCLPIYILPRVRVGQWARRNFWGDEGTIPELQGLVELSSSQACPPIPNEPLRGKRPPSSHPRCLTPLNVPLDLLQLSPSPGWGPGPNPVSQRSMRHSPADGPTPGERSSPH